MATHYPVRVFAYDVTSDRNRNKIAELLEEVAIRIQLSVFEARMSDAELSSLMKQLEPLFEQGDKLRVYTLSDRQLNACHQLGGSPLPEPQDFWLL